MSIRTQRSSARIGAATIVAALLASLFAFIAPADAAQVVTVSRTSGPDRYATAAEIALADFPVAERPVSNVILASGENFPDGLAAASLAGAANAPVLLTQTNALPAATATALAALAPETVHIVGGTAAVSAGVRATLTSLGYTLNDISGADRYATAAAVSQFMRSSVAPIGTFGGQRTAIVATGLNWPDALAGGAPAAAGNHPILLTGSTLPAATSAELTAAGVQRVIILGGTAAVPAAVETAIQGLGIATTRVSGATRYETATALANILMTPAPAGFTFSTTGVFLVSGSNFPDALSAGPWAGRSDQAILLAGGQGTLDFLTSRNATIATIRVIGGTAAVSEAQAQAAQQAATTATPTAQVAAFAGSTGIRVTFSERVTGTGTVQVSGQAAVNCVAPANAAPCVLNAAGTELIVTAPAAVAPGSVITVSGFRTPIAAGDRQIGATTFTVGNDAAGTGTINAVAGSNTFTIVTNRSAVIDLADVTINNAALPGGSTIVATDAPFNTRWLVTLGGGAELVAGTVIRVQDAFTAGGAVLTVPQRTVQADLIAPTLNAQFLSVVGSRGILNTAGAVNAGNVQVQADAIGPESTRIQVALVDPGAPSSPLTVAVTAPAANQTLITVNLATNAAGTITSTPAQVAAAINANATAAALVTATASDPTSTAAIAPAAATALSAGTRTAAVTLLYSEALRPPASSATISCVNVPGVGQIYWDGVFPAGAPAAPNAGITFGLDLNGNGNAEIAAPSSIFCGVNAAGTTATNLATGQLTVTFTLGLDQTAATGVSQIRTAGVQDLAGNQAAFVARTLAAVPAP